MIPMNDVEYLLGNFERFSPLREPPYSKRALDFFGALAQVLRADPAVKAFPDLAAFAFWCRPANLARMKTTLDTRKRLGRGTVFHIAPSNVPMNFAYSLAFGLLAGCANIVRVPGGDFPQIDSFVRAWRSVLEKDDFALFRDKTLLVRYGHDDEITGRFSARCDARVIWGGDETIQRIRRLPIPPQGVEITFADRYSFALMNPAAVEQLGEPEWERLCDRFTNDALMMGQRACSSPHLIVWIGEKSPAGRERFWRGVARSASRFPIEPSRVMDRFVRLCGNAIDFETQGTLEWFGGKRLGTVRLAALPERLDALRGDFGLFYEYDAENLDTLALRITEKFQTAVCFGVEPETVADWVIKNRLRGIDRIVPVGSALSIGPIWDGFDIVGTLSRIVSDSEIYRSGNKT